MRWTPDKIAELRDHADDGAGALAERFGISKSAVYQIALRRLGIYLTDTGVRSRRFGDEDDVRARWAVRLPAMKAALRAEILRDTA